MNPKNFVLQGALLIPALTIALFVGFVAARILRRVQTSDTYRTVWYLLTPAVVVVTVLSLRFFLAWMAQLTFGRGELGIIYLVWFPIVGVFALPPWFILGALVSYIPASSDTRRNRRPRIFAVVLGIGSLAIAGYFIDTILLKAARRHAAFGRHASSAPLTNSVFLRG